EAAAREGGPRLGGIPAGARRRHGRSPRLPPPGEGPDRRAVARSVPDLPPGAARSDVRPDARGPALAGRAAPAGNAADVALPGGAAGLLLPVHGGPPPLPPDLRRRR